MKKSEKQPIKHIEYLVHLYYEHKIALFLSLQRLYRQKFQVIGAIFLIGLAMALSIAFCIFANIAHDAQKQLAQSPSITIFAKVNLLPTEFRSLEERLNRIHSITDIKLITAKELGSGIFSEPLPDSLWRTLPNIYTARLVDHNISQSVLKDLHARISKDPAITDVIFDFTWQSQVRNIIALSQGIIWIVGLVLVSSVVLMINYSVRLLMEKYKDEISVLYDLGASASFIQRPYLYQGFFLGFFGAVAALLFLGISFLAIQHHLYEFSDLFMITNSIQSTQLLYLLGSLLFVVLFALICSFFSIKKWLTLFEQQFTH